MIECNAQGDPEAVFVLTKTELNEYKERIIALEKGLRKYADAENWLYFNPLPEGGYQSTRWVGEGDPLLMAKTLLEGK